VWGEREREGVCDIKVCVCVCVCVCERERERESTKLGHVDLTRGLCMLATLNGRPSNAVFFTAGAI
jgi:hypothetical protein